MPDPIISDQTQNTSPPTFPEMTDIPAMPVVDTPPLDIPPIIASPNTPKKRSGKLIATILGILLLVGAVGAGVVLVGQKQLFEQKAYLPCFEVGDCYPSNYQCTNNYGQLDCGNNKICGVGCQAPCTEGSNRDADCTQTLDGQTCPGKKLEICQNGNWGGNYPCLDIADNCPSTQQDCSPVCVTDHPDGDPYCNAGGYRCQNYIGDWAKPKSCFASGSCSAPFSYSSGNYCVNTSSNCNPGPGCSTAPDPSCTATTPPGATPTPQNCGRCSNLPGQENCWVTWTDLNGGCDSDYYNNRVENCPDSRCVTSTPTPTPTPTGALRACNTSCQADSQCSTGYCTTQGSVCRNRSCPSDTDCICTGTSTPTPTPRVTATPTPTPGINAMCSSVKAYDTNWNLLTSAQLSALKAGDKVRFTVSGIPADQIDKARFTINGVLGPETTTKKPGTNEYYIEYTIPTGVTSFTVTAQIHHLTLGWF